MLPAWAWQALAEDDAAAAAHLHRQCFPFGWESADFISMLATPGTVSSGVWREKELLGLILWRHDGEGADLLTLATHPGHRRLGMAGHMMQRSETELMERRIGRLILEVGAGNDAARSLYDRLGYRPIAERRGYYRLPDGRREDAIVLEKRLG